MKKILMFIFIFLLWSCKNQEAKMESYRFYAMDTIVTIQFYGVENSKELSKEVEKIYLKYDAVASDYQTGYHDVSVFDLNKTRKVIVSDELLELIQFGVNMKNETNGYYNPFIGKLSHAWKEAFEQKQLLSDAVVQELLNESLNTSLEIDDHMVCILGDGNLDLGGVAKGFATHKAEEYLKEKNCNHFLLNAGNSNIVLGSKMGDFFSVGLSQAFGAEYYKILKLKDICVSTSSIKEQNVAINGKVYSHLINAKTGYPAEIYDTLSVFGSHSGILDAYSTACFSMELEEAKRFLKQRGLDFICSKDNQLYYQSDGVE